MVAVPTDDTDFYSDEVIRNPWPLYAHLRSLGPVVWLSKHENYALTRHQEVAWALRSQDLFISGRGVAADAYANEISKGNSAGSDGERHRTIRQATSAPLLPGALIKIRPLIDAAAQELIERLIAMGRFDGVSDLSTHLPLTIVRDLVGLPDFGRENMLRWANATFDLLGVQNERGKAALDVFLEQRRFAQTQTADQLKPGSWTRRLFDLADKGLLPRELAAVAMRDYLNPSLDTTISATGQLLWQLGRNPDQWARLREEPALARNAVNEAVRMASPVRSFARHTSCDVEVGDHVIPEGARVMMLYASANRDERVFENPDTFDITRSPREHLGFGSGVHMCVGMHLAQLEMIALIEAMIPRVARIEVEEPVIGLNNTIHGFSSLPARFIAANDSKVAVARATEVAPAPARATLLEGVVTARWNLAEDIIGLQIAPTATEFPAWTAGSHVDIHVDGDIIRQYSLTGDPEANDSYTIAVQREPLSRGGSAGIHASFKEGDTVTLSAPRNHFVLNEGRHSYLLLSGGIGITPILAMAWRLHALNREFTWHVSARSRARLAWADQLSTLPFADSIVLHFDDGDDDQRLDAQQLMREAGPQTDVYCCGPRGYMDYVIGAASEAGLPEAQLHVEHFGAEIDTDGDPFTVVAARSGLRLTVAPDETMLSVVLRAGLKVEVGCHNGLCGSCLTGVLDGRPDHRDMVLTAEEKARNDRVALCCSRSQTPELVLDL